MKTFHFLCNNCQEQFNVQMKYLLKKDSIVCPNCSIALPDDTFKHLKSVASSLDEYQKCSKDGPDYFILTIQ